MAEVVNGLKGRKMEWALPASVSPCFYRDFPDSPPDTDGKALFILVRGGGAITSEVMVAVNGSVREVDRTTYYTKLCSENMGMNNLINTRTPKHFTKASIESCLHQILLNQEVIARTFWEGFQSNGQRIDKHDLDFDGIRGRLWRIECVLKMRMRK